MKCDVMLKFKGTAKTSESNKIFFARKKKQSINKKKEQKPKKCVKKCVSKGVFLGVVKRDSRLKEY